MTTREQFLAVAENNLPLRAPYTFVPLNDVVLPSPLPDGPDLGRPLADGLCGELKVEWRIETPILIGSSADNNAPFQLGGDYALPGASLRGMVRAVLEILAGAHLDLTDDSLFATRDYESVTWQNVLNPRNNPPRGSPRHIIMPSGKTRLVLAPLAAWLKKDGDGAILRECDYVEIEIADIADACGIGVVDWHCKTLHERHDLLNSMELAGEIDLGLISPRLAGTRGTLVVAGQIKSVVDWDAAGRRGNVPTNKEREAAFLGGKPIAKTTINAEALARFIEVQPADGAGHTGPPGENWSYWAPKFEGGTPVPVFFRGDPAAAKSGVPPPTRFVMGLTRLLRVPYAQTVHAVRGGSQKELPGQQLDFVQALFGHVPQDKADSTGTGRQRAWRSRVRFAIATPADGVAPQTLAPRPAVTMKPRASFYPFYLRPRDGGGLKHPVDWSNPRARLAGRKRYPVRNGAWPPNNLPRAPGGSAEQENNLVFLDASLEAPLRFTSRIRFHNLLPAELGGLVWAIGLGQHGQAEQPLRHMLGRGKTFGHGQVQALIADGARILPNDGKDAPTLTDCMVKFEKWALKAANNAGQESGSDFQAQPIVRALLATCDPSHGASLDSALRFPKLDGEAETAKRVLAAYQEIKKRAGCQPSPNNPDSKRQGGKAVSRDPGDDAFLFLPDFPLPEGTP